MSLVSGSDSPMYCFNGNTEECYQKLTTSRLHKFLNVSSAIRQKSFEAHTLRFRRWWAHERQLRRNCCPSGSYRVNRRTNIWRLQHNRLNS